MTASPMGMQWSPVSLETTVLIGIGFRVGLKNRMREDRQQPTLGSSSTDRQIYQTRWRKDVWMSQTLTVWEWRGDWEGS